MWSEHKATMEPFDKNVSLHINMLKDRKLLWNELPVTKS